MIRIDPNERIINVYSTTGIPCVGSFQIGATTSPGIFHRSDDLTDKLSGAPVIRVQTTKFSFPVGPNQTKIIYPSIIAPYSQVFQERYDGVFLNNVQQYF